MSNRGLPRGRLFVVSAPSGTGKTTTVAAAIAKAPGVVRSCSFTSRPARPGEQDGEDYHFVSRTRFESMIAGDQFLEWAEFGGNLYGTALLNTDRTLAEGLDVVFVIEVNGARQLRRRRPEAISVFLMPPSTDELERRLRGRGLNDEADVRVRLATARHEMAAWQEYDYVVINDDIERCVDELRSIFLAERARRVARQAEAEAIVAAFASAPDAAGGEGT